VDDHPNLSLILHNFRSISPYTFSEVGNWKEAFTHVYHGTLQRCNLARKTNWMPLYPVLHAGPDCIICENKNNFKSVFYVIPLVPFWFFVPEKPISCKK